jgi:hypothetical protein
MTKPVAGALVAGLFALALSGAAHAQTQALSGSDVETLLRGKTFNTEDFGGTGQITWNADGTLAVNIRRPDGSTVQDTGTYHFDGHGYCSTWRVLRTTERCFTLARTGANTFTILNLDGSVDSRLTSR